MTEEWQCSDCGDKDVPEEFRVFGRCYKCAAAKSIATRDRQITKLNADVDRLDWLQERIVDTIYLDDGQIIDVRGGDIRKAIDKARPQPEQTE